MLNIPVYDSYNGEKRIALLDNSAIAFLLQLDSRGHHPERLLQEYDVIFLPEWVAVEVQDSEFRVKYVEKLVNNGIPIRIIKESAYGDLMDGEEIYLFHIVKATVSGWGAFLKYMRLNVEKEDLLDTEVLTVYTQDRDSYAFQKQAEEELKKIFKDKSPVSVTYRSNDSIMYQLYREHHLSLEEIAGIRKDIRYVTYTLKRADGTIALETKKLNNEEFMKIIQDDSVQIIF